MDEKSKPVKEELNDLKNSYKDSSKNEGNELLQFFIGVILLGIHGESVALIYLLAQ